MTTWHGPRPPDAPALGLRDRMRVARRGVPMAILVFGGLLLLLLVRLVERPVCGLRRPVSPWITVAVCRGALQLLGLRRTVRGEAMTGGGAMVANHASWLDVFALNAARPLYFVAKAEVAGWPGIGWLARATGTVFVLRDPREAPAQRATFEARLRAGHLLCFFPEGTSTDGRRVLPFKPTLFAAFFTAGLRDDVRVQPVSLAYHAPPDAVPSVYGWWGDMGFGLHLLAMLAQPRHGRVEVDYHAPIAVAQAGDRKALARMAEGAVRDGLTASGISAAAP